MRKDDESAARAIAENVVLILNLRPVECGFRSAGHKAVLAGLMRELLTAMPTASSDALATACNRFLDTLPNGSERRPWVEAVDPGGGGVTMREGSVSTPSRGTRGAGFCRGALLFEHGVSQPVLCRSARQPRPARPAPQPTS